MWLFQHKVFTIIKEIAATFRSNILLMLHLLLKVISVPSTIFVLRTNIILISYHRPIRCCKESSWYVLHLLLIQDVLQNTRKQGFINPTSYWNRWKALPQLHFTLWLKKTFFSADCITRLLDHHLPTNFSRIWPSTLSLSTHNRAFTGQFGPRFLVHWKNRISPDFLFSELWIVATETFAMLRLIAVDKCSISSKVAEAAKLEAAKLIVFEEDFCGVWEGCWLLRRIQKNITPPQVAYISKAC